MPIKERYFLRELMTNLGYDAPSEEDLTAALKKAFVTLKDAQGVDADAVKYQFSLVPVSREWAEEAFDKTK